MTPLETPETSTYLFSSWSAWVWGDFLVENGERWTEPKWVVWECETNEKTPEKWQGRPCCPKARVLVRLQVKSSRKLGQEVGNHLTSHGLRLVTPMKTYLGKLLPQTLILRGNLISCLVSYSLIAGGLTDPHGHICTHTYTVSCIPQGTRPLSFPASGRVSAGWHVCVSLRFYLKHLLWLNIYWVQLREMQRRVCLMAADRGILIWCSRRSRDLGGHDWREGQGIMFQEQQQKRQGSSRWGKSSLWFKGKCDFKVRIH